MGIRFKCHHCQAPLNIKTELANKRGVCPECHGKFRIPNESREWSLCLEEKSLSPSREWSGTHSMISNSPQTASHPLPALSQITASGASSDTPRSESTTNEPPYNEPQYMVRPPSGGEYGPAGKQTIELWITQRRITGDTLICRTDSSQWKKAKEVFASHFVLG